MTRINLIPPRELTDQHLIAEYREMRLLTANVRRLFGLNSGKPKTIPPKFTLNKGHVLFFMDKGAYIADRYQRVQEEMKHRGFTPQFPTLDLSAWPEGYCNDWTPTEEDCNIVRERIALRISQRPGWYRQNGKPLETPT